MTPRCHCKVKNHRIVFCKATEGLYAAVDYLMVLLLRKGLEIRLPCINPFFRDENSYLLGLIRGFVTDIPVQLLDKFSRAFMHYSANWFPRKNAVILFRCDSDNVPFVLFFHKKTSLPFCRFKCIS